MAAIYETLAPSAGRKLTIGNREPFEIEGSYEAKAIRERAAVYHDGWLDQADLAERPISGNRICVGVEEYTVPTHLDGG
jgi:hypothetical protein